MTAPTPSELEGWLAEHAIESVRLVLLDLHGVPRAKLVSAAHFPRVARAGHPWALPLLAVDIWQGMSPEERELGVETGWGNGVARPDLSTLRRGTIHLVLGLLSTVFSLRYLADQAAATMEITE